MSLHPLVPSALAFIIFKFKIFDERERREDKSTRMDKYTGRVSGILSATPSCFKQHNMFFQSIIVGAFIGECSPRVATRETKQITVETIIVYPDLATPSRTSVFPSSTNQVETV